MSTAAHPRLSMDKRHVPNNGVAYGKILDHVVTYAGNYPVQPPERSTARPTRTAQNAQTNRRGSTMSIPAGSSSRPTSINAYSSAAAEFTTGLINQISGSGTQTGSISLAFVNNFLRQCFTPELEEVDFPQALSALDHLADLESWRRKETNSALKRLGVSRDRLQSEAKKFARDNPGVAAWIKDVEPSEKKVEAMYTQLYVGLRRWILINEFSLRPFNPHNCLAMLNTLFPPPNRGERGPNPTPALTPAILHKQRETYIAYMTAVESRGPEVLCNLIDQNRRPGEETGWPAVRETLDKYLRVTSRLVDEAKGIEDVRTLSRNDSSRLAVPAAGSKHQRTRSDSTGGMLRQHTADSGIGFDEHSQGDRSGRSSGSYDTRGTREANPQPTPNTAQFSRNPPAPTTITPTRRPVPRQQVQQQAVPGSTLEKIASSVRKFTSRHKQSSSRDDDTTYNDARGGPRDGTRTNPAARAPPTPKQGAAKPAPAPERRPERKRERSPSNNRAGGIWGSSAKQQPQPEPARRPRAPSGKVAGGRADAFPYDRHEAMRQQALYDAKHNKRSSRVM